MRRLLFNLHLYAAWIAGVFIAILGTTGSVMAFEQEIDQLLHWSLYHVMARGRPLSLSETGAIVTRTYPGERIRGYRVPIVPGRSYQVELRRGLVFVNPYTGELLGVQPGGMDFLGYVHQFHLRLLIRGGPDVGRKIVSWAAAALLFLLISGVYLWWPYKRATIERRESSKRFWFDVHAAVGIFSFVFLLLLTVTGLVIGWEHATTPLLYQITGSKPAPPPPVKIVPPPGAQPIGPDRVLEIARNAVPGAAPFAFNVPQAGESCFVRMRYPEDLTGGGRSAALIDPYSGQVIWTQSSRTAPAGTRAVILNRAIHTGELLGMPGKTLASLASLMAVIQVLSGAMMWWRGRQARRRAALSR